MSQFSFKIQVEPLPTFDFTIRGMHTTPISLGNVSQELRTLCRVVEGCINAVHESVGIPQSHNYDYGVSATELLVQNPPAKKTARRIKTKGTVESGKAAAAAADPFDSVGGCTEAKKALKDFAEGLLYPQVYDIFGVSPPRGILLHGPPGTGKTALLRAMAKVAHANIEFVDSSKISSMWYGESERRINELFERAAKNAPFIIVIDEIDALVSQRDVIHEASQKVLSIILQRMDGLDELKGVLVIGTTNRKDALDKAILRPGRFDKIVEVGLPDDAARAEIFRIHLRGKPVESGIDYAELSKLSAGKSGADIVGAITSALEPKVKDYREALKAAERDGSKTPVVPEQVTMRELVAVLKPSAKANTLPTSARNAYG